MKILQVLTLVLTQLSVGMWLLGAVIPPRALPAPFFSFSTLLATVLAAVALLLAKLSLPLGWADMRFLGLAVILGTVAFGCYRLEWRDLGRALAIVAGLLSLVLGLLPLADKLLGVWEFETKVPYVFAATTLAGAMLLGSAYVTFFLRQWDSYVPGPVFGELLARMVGITSIALGARLLLLTGALAAMSQLDPQLARTYIPGLWTEDLPLLAARVLFGLAFPAVFLWQMHRPRPVHEPVPAGRLGLTFSSVMVGELCAGFLLL